MRVHVVLWGFCAARLTATLYKRDGITTKEHHVDVMKHVLKSAARELKAGSSMWTMTPSNKGQQGATKPRYAQSPDLSPVGYNWKSMFRQQGPQIWVSFISFVKWNTSQLQQLWRSLRKNTQNIWPELNHEHSPQPKTLLLFLVGFFWSNYPTGLSGLLQLVALSFGPIASLNPVPGYFLQQYPVVKMGLWSLWSLSLFVLTSLSLLLYLQPGSQLICSFSNLSLPGPPSNCTLFNTPATCRYDSTYPTSQTQQSCSI